MTRRENFLSMIRRQGYEWMDPYFGMCPSLYEQFEAKVGKGVRPDEYFEFAWRFVEDIRLKDHDVEKYRGYFNPPLSQDSYIDTWGVGHEHSPYSMHMTYMRNPLKNMETLEEMQAYPFPDYGAGDASHQKAQVEEIKGRDLIAVADMACTIWETAWYLRGMEELFCDMMEENEMAEYLFDKVLELEKIRAKAFLEAGVDILYFGDDIGMQHTVMMSEELYCRWIKPRLKELIDFARALNPKILIFYHSCGFVEPFIPHLIDAGIDVLNPIQSECMDFAQIHAKYGDKLSFSGTIGTQTTMPHGTPQEVKEEVWKNLDIAGEKGGLMVVPTHLLEPEVPLENVFAYVEACREYKPGKGSKQ